MKTKLLLVIFMISAIPVTGQTSVEIEAKYGKPMPAYSVTEHIWMTPDFAADGQVCRMRFYPKRVQRGIGYVDGKLNFAELKYILNAIVPPLSRGNKKDGFGLSDLGGGMGDTHFDYEKVSFSFVTSIDTHRLAESIIKGELDSSIGLDFPIDLDTPIPPTPPPSESDFDGSIGAEIVTLSWNDRKCVKDDEEVAARLKGVQIESQFGAPEKTYSVGEFISMTPAFAPDGQVCQMWIYPKRVSETSSILGTTLQFDQLRNSLNRLVPPEQRGLKQTMNFGTTATGGNMAWTTYPYENVSFSFWEAPAEVKSGYVEPALKRGEFTFSIPPGPEPVPKYRLASRDDFEKTDNTALVVVRWEHRQCAGF